jgi:hypothetical protein
VYRHFRALLRARQRENIPMPMESACFDCKQQLIDVHQSRRMTKVLQFDCRPSTNLIEGVIMKPDILAAEIYLKPETATDFATELNQHADAWLDEWRQQMQLLREKYRFEDETADSVHPQVRH